MKPNFKPYDLATIQLPTSERRRTVEVLSYPTPDDTIMVRMVPGDPTTLREVKVDDLEPRARQRYCRIARVRCRFDFPEDMLRYDDAALCDPDQSEDFRTDAPVLIYRLTDYKRGTCWTEGRWASFSASIEQVATCDLRAQNGFNVVKKARAK
jgi:hypothetical protein